MCPLRFRVQQVTPVSSCSTFVHLCYYYSSPNYINFILGQHDTLNQTAISTLVSLQFILHTVATVNFKANRTIGPISPLQILNCS